MAPHLDTRFLMPASPAPPVVLAPPSAPPEPPAPHAAGDQVTLGQPDASPSQGPSPVATHATSSGLPDLAIIERLAHQMAPILQQIVPQLVLQQVAGIMSGAAQELGKTAPTITPAEASAFVLRLAVQEFSEKVAERLEVASPGQRVQLLRAATALTPVLAKATVTGQLGQVVANPPPEMDAFLDAYLCVGVPTPEEINRQVASHPPTTPGEAVQQITGRPSVPGQDVQLFVDGKTAYPEMERLIRSARQSILMETYTWHDDDSGRRLADLLIERKNAGLDVRVIYDSVGQNSYGPDRPKQNLAMMAAAGIEVREFNRALLESTGVNLTHRKLLIADGRAAMTGGMNIGDNYHLHWHDAMVRLDGSAVGDLAREFAYDYRRAGGTAPLPGIPPASTRPLGGSAEVSVCVSSPREGGRATEIRRSMIAAVDAARSSIWIENPYFSDPHLVAHLQAAQQRGVQVGVILPRGNDEPLFPELNAISARRLSADGARIHVIDTGAGNEHFNHTKMLMVDDSWVMMGSANMDPRSFEENQELTLGVTDRDLARDVRERMIGPDLERCVDFTPGTPPANARLLELLGTFL